MKLLAFCFLLVTLCIVKGASAGSTKKWKCLPEDETEIDRIAAEAIVIGTGENFPINSKEMRALCV